MASELKQHSQAIGQSARRIKEIIQALDEEIDAIKTGSGGKNYQLFNGRYLREIADQHIYIFEFDSVMNALDDTPAEIDIDGHLYNAHIIVTSDASVEVGISKHFGDHIREARLITKLWYLLEQLKQKYIECQSGSSQADFRMSDMLFDCRPSAIKDLNNLKPNYSLLSDPPNKAQQSAIEASFSHQLSIIWGPPGTGKTKTIAKAVEAHLNAGRKVLLVSHANNAVDEALEDIAEHLKDTSYYQDGKLVRLGKPQEDHYKRIEHEYPFVLLNKIVEKRGEVLSTKRVQFVGERESIAEKILQTEIVMHGSNKIKTIKEELPNLRLSLDHETQRYNETIRELATLKQELDQDHLRLADAQSSGTLRRMIKGLNPERLRANINKLTIKIDSLENSIPSRNVQVSKVQALINASEKELTVLEQAVEKALKSLNIDVGKVRQVHLELSSKIKTIQAKIGEIDKALDELQTKILSEARLIATTLTKAAVSKQFPNEKFDVLILDESSMAPLPFLYWATSRCTKYVTIVGDFLQLPPICKSKAEMAKKWVGKSIYEVVNINTVPNAESSNHVKLLDVQYRMHPDISGISNELFYQNKIQDHIITKSYSTTDGFSSSPLVLIDTGDVSPWCTKGRFNLYNAIVTMSLVERIRTSNAQAAIGVVTPYRMQAELLRKIAKDKNLSAHLNINTIHRFQGGEAEIIIFDTVEGRGIDVWQSLDSVKDESANLILNVALTRAKSRLYLIGNTTYLLKQVNSKSSLARLVHHFTLKAESHRSEELVDNFISADFDKWSNLIKRSTPPETSIDDRRFNENTFWPKFFEDMINAKKRVIIYSPFLTLNGASRISDYFKLLINNGIEIIVHAYSPRLQQGNMAEQSDKAIPLLRDLGVIVHVEDNPRNKKHFKTAFIDDYIVWDGSLNILSHKDTQERMWLISGQNTVEQLMKDCEVNRNVIRDGNAPTVCDKYGSPMILKTGKHGEFYSCSKYPVCKGAKNILSTSSKANSQ